jgi:hypothetical protein
MSRSSFQTTQWSVVLSGGDAESRRSREALVLLCPRYWQPLYVFAPRQGHARHDAEVELQLLLVAPTI